MIELRFALCLPLVLTGALSAQSSSTVVPSAYSVLDANSHLGFAGATSPGRHQILIGSSHLVGLVNRDVTAIEFRRSAADEAFQGGVVSATVTVSTSPNAPLTCSRNFAANVGPDVVTVFQGSLALPHSLPQPGPSVSWTNGNTILIPFAQPFR